jgi:ABC-2 type transport system permease protein
MPGRKIAAIALKDLRSTVRNVSALVMMIAAPLALASLLGFAFGGSESFDIAAIKVALANLDEGITASSVGAEGTGAAGGGSGDTSTGGAGPAENANAGDALQGVLTSSQLADVLAVTPMRSAVAARRAVDDGSAAVGVIVPADLSRVIAGSMQAATSRVELYENPTADIGGSIVEGVVGGVLADLNGARAAAVAAVALRSDGAGDPPAA